MSRSLSLRGGFVRPTLLCRAAVSVSVVLAAGLVSASAAPAAQAAGARAAGARAWRVVETFGPVGQVTSVVAVGSGHTWVTGLGGPAGASPVLFVSERSGATWSQLPLPSDLAGFVGAVTGNPVVAASSATNAWVFASTASSYEDMALGWNGTEWTSTAFPVGSVVNSAVAFSPTDAWALGGVYCCKADRPFVMRYNGKQWSPVKTPILVDYASAVSPGDIWAVGNSPKPKVSGYTAIHWTGRSWHTVAFPNFHLPKGVSATPEGIVAFSARNVWVDFSVTGRESGAGLAHWNGKRWTAVHQAYQASSFGTMSQDGHGGIWLSANGPAPKYYSFLFHERNGHWTYQDMPSAGGQSIELNAISWNPGSSTGWAAGALPEKDGSTLGAVLEYGG
jgi:hypothetical protein